MVINPTTGLTLYQRQLLKDFPPGFYQSARDLRLGTSDPLLRLCRRNLIERHPLTPEGSLKMNVKYRLTKIGIEVAKS